MKHFPPVPYDDILFLLELLKLCEWKTGSINLKEEEKCAIQTHLRRAVQ